MAISFAPASICRNNTEEVVQRTNIKSVSKSCNCQPIINITIDQLLLLLLLLVVVLVLLPVVQPQTPYFSVHSLITIQFHYCRSHSPVYSGTMSRRYLNKKEYVDNQSLYCTGKENMSKGNVFFCYI
jgi:hypothetical protein